MKRIAIFTIDEVFPFVSNELHKTKHGFTVGDKVYKVKMTSQRLRVFKLNPKCVGCGLEGSFFALEYSKDENPHMNFYAIKDGEEILMTKDHIIPVSKGGQDSMSNYQTMCFICNNKKSNNDIL
jgi:5-methylcytosine-specific restriction endonuclease McrA